MPELYDRILDAVVAKLTALQLPGVTVYRQRYPEFGNASSTAVIVSYFGEIEDVGDGDWAADWIGIPILVQYFAPTLTDPGDEVQEAELTARGQIYDALAFRRLTGVPEVTSIRPEPRPVAEPDIPTGLSRPSGGTLLMRSGMLFRAMARRARAA